MLEVFETANQNWSYLFGHLSLNHPFWCPVSKEIAIVMGKKNIFCVIGASFGLNKCEKNILLSRHNPIFPSAVFVPMSHEK